MPRDAEIFSEAPFEVVGPDRPSPWLVICDHARNRVPDSIGGGSLGLSETDMARHIAYDVGAEGVARHLAARLHAPCVLSTFSRLVIDPNRGADDPTLVMRLYDGTVIPGNRTVDAAEVAHRVDTLYAPYHNQVAEVAARHEDTVILSIHSFTPKLAGRPLRPWHVSVLSAQDRRLGDPLLHHLAADSAICVGDNEPYGGYLPGDSVDRHAAAHGRRNTLIEIRNDLIATPAQQAAWADRLAPALTAALSETSHG